MSNIEMQQMHGKYMLYYYLEAQLEETTRH